MFIRPRSRCHKAQKHMRLVLMMMMLMMIRMPMMTTIMVMMMVSIYVTKVLLYMVTGAPRLSV